MIKKQNLYNKYRPKLFKEIFGQIHLKKILINILKSQKLIQSYVFYGHHGVGKTSIARIFAKGWNCLNFEEDICNKCKNCKFINEKNSLDILEIDGASNNGVNHVRELVENVTYLPLNLKKKIYIIDESHNLSSQSWNAFLKIIEEPPQHIIFLFLTTKIQKIIPTVLSRCQKLKFSLLNDEEMLNIMQMIIKKEKKIINESLQKKIINLSGGSPRDMLSLLEPLFLNNEVDLENKKQKNTISFLEDNQVVNFLKILFFASNNEALKKFKNIYYDGWDLQMFFNHMFEIILELEIFLKTNELSILKILSNDDIKHLFNKNINYQAILNFLNDAVFKFKDSGNSYSFGKLILLNIIEILNKNSQFKENKNDLKEETTLNITKQKSDKDLKETKSIKKNTLQKEEKSFDESKMFKTTTIKIFPEKLEKHINELNSMPKIKKYKNEILYCIKFLDKKNTINNNNIFDEYKKQPNKLIEIENLFFNKEEKYGFLTSDCAVLIIFENEQDVKIFNKKILKNEIKENLEKIFKQNFFWFSLSKEEFFKYFKKSKKISKSDLSKKEIFKTSEDNLYSKIVKEIK